MSQSATPAPQNDIGTCLETFETERFCGFPIDTAMPHESQRIETRHVGASKRAFRARLNLQVFTLCSFKIDVFLQGFLWTSKFATSKSRYRARFPSIFITWHKMPRLPRTARCHHFPQALTNEFVKTCNATPVKCYACSAKWRWRSPAVPATKTATHCLKTTEKYCACRKKKEDYLDTLLSGRFLWVN